MAAARAHFNLTTTSHQLQQQQRQYYSPWHSPIPYLFGGLAAILGLVAFSLILLACSYWRLSGHFDHPAGNIEAGEGKDEEGLDAGEGKEGSFLEELRVVVIMAGEDMPTFLAKATPMWSRRTSYIGGSCDASFEADDQGAREMKPGRCPRDDAADNV
ncbi:hypothetical protein MLD38_015257 [Melastoma candidum]|uniref:Uncharacterized protein n=1 Tax=Melastoma candidum TaxID=119954 RepID=A0ACB9RFD8_9MYRT|nr:hypothetical protein MLD38_015257 [Melastoma candidum]